MIDKNENILKAFGIGIEEDQEKDLDFITWCAKEGQNERIVVLGIIFHAVGNLNIINDIFEYGKSTRSARLMAKYLGIFESKNSSIRFVDKFNIVQYFLAYNRKKDVWDKYKGRWFSLGQLEKIIKGNIDYDWWKTEKYLGDMKK